MPIPIFVNLQPTWCCHLKPLNAAPSTFVYNLLADCTYDLKHSEILFYSLIGCLACYNGQILDRPKEVELVKLNENYRGSNRSVLWKYFSKTWEWKKQVLVFSMCITNGFSLTASKMTVTTKKWLFQNLSKWLKLL